MFIGMYPNELKIMSTEKPMHTMFIAPFILNCPDLEAIKMSIAECMDKFTVVYSKLSSPKKEMIYKVMNREERT